MFRTRWTDTTAILKLIETRLHLAALTKRDAAQMDRTECFDFTHPSILADSANASGAEHERSVRFE